MANVGLRNDTKQMKISIAGVDCYLNLSRQDKNLLHLYPVDYNRCGPKLQYHIVFFL